MWVEDVKSLHLIRASLWYKIIFEHENAIKIPCFTQWSKGVIDRKALLPIWPFFDGIGEGGDIHIVELAYLQSWKWIRLLHVQYLVPPLLHPALRTMSSFSPTRMAHSSVFWNTRTNLQETGATIANRHESRAWIWGSPPGRHYGSTYLHQNNCHSIFYPAHQTETWAADPNDTEIHSFFKNNEKNSWTLGLQPGDGSFTQASRIAGRDHVSRFYFLLVNSVKQIL